MKNTPVLVVALLALPLAAQTSKPQQSCGGRVKLQNIWTQLQKLHDKDGDGKITKKEFVRGKKQFQNHDRNRDGVISAKDFPEGRWWNGFGPGMARRADRNRDREVSKEEWQAFVKMLDADGNGVIDQEEFGRMAGKQIARKMKILALSFDQDGDGRIEASDFDSLFLDLDRNGDGKLAGADLRGNQFIGATPRGQKPPRQGDIAPDFELPRSDNPKKTVRLSSYRGKKPVALIFGSYT